MASLSLRWALLAVALWLGTGAAQAQIVHEKPSQVKAANRRALREAKRTDAPYKDSHLEVTPDRLKRGASVQPQTPASRDVDYKKGTAPNVKPSGLLGLRRDKMSTVVRREQRQRNRMAAKASEKK